MERRGLVVFAIAAGNERARAREIRGWAESLCSSPKEAMTVLRQLDGGDRGRRRVRGRGPREDNWRRGWRAVAIKSTRVADDRAPAGRRPGGAQREGQRDCGVFCVRACIKSNGIVYTAGTDRWCARPARASAPRAAERLHGKTRRHKYTRAAARLDKKGTSFFFALLAPGPKTIFLGQIIFS